MFVYLVKLRTGGRFVVVAADAGYAIDLMNEWIGEDYRDHEPVEASCVGPVAPEYTEPQVLCRQYDPF